MQGCGKMHKCGLRLFPLPSVARDLKGVYEEAFFNESWVHMGKEGVQVLVMATLFDA